MKSELHLDWEYLTPQKDSFRRSVEIVDNIDCYQTNPFLSSLKTVSSMDEGGCAPYTQDNGNAASY
jgi:hypothetical protein